MNLALRVMKTPGAGPAIGTTEDGSWPVIGVDSLQLGGETIEHLRPGQRDELIPAATPIRPGPSVSQPRRTMG